MKYSAWAIGLFLVGVCPGIATAQLSEIGIGDFSGGESVESFDGTVGENFGSSELFGDLTITSNNATIFRGDFGNFDPHGGSGDPALFDQITTASDLTLEFAYPTVRVGFLLAGGNSTTSWTVSVYDGSGGYLGARVVNFVASLGFPNDPPVFIGFTAPEGIGRIEIDEGGDNGQYTGLDDVRYEDLISEIGIDDFTGGESVETFDGTVGENFGSSEVFGNLTITSNNASIFRGDFGNFDPHGGSGDPALFDLMTTGSDLTLEWALPMTRVGFLLAGGNSTTSWTVSVYDGDGHLLGARVIDFVVSLGFPNDPPVFVGLESSRGIGRLEIDEGGDNGQYTGLDDIRYEDAISEIGLDGFSGGEMVETFDGTVGENFGASGVFGDLTVTSNNASVFRGDYGNFDPHGGSGDPALFDLITTGSDLTFEWALPMTHVGFLLAGGNSTTSWTVSVYDGDGGYLGARVIDFVVSLGFPNDPPVFVGLTASEGIGRIEIDEDGDNGQYSGLDDVRYEAFIFANGFENNTTSDWSRTVP